MGKSPQKEIKRDLVRSRGRQALDKNGETRASESTKCCLNPMNKDHQNPQELDLTKPRLASYKSGKCTKIRCTGSMFSLLNGKE